MYRYDNSDSIEYKINKYINNSMNYESVYRVILINERLFIIFYNEELLMKFMDKYVSKYTCDTSGFLKYGLSIVIDDYSAMSSIISKARNEY